jgi:hypothetical protein
VGARAAQEVDVRTLAGDQPPALDVVADGAQDAAERRLLAAPDRRENRQACRRHVTPSIAIRARASFGR